MTNPFLQAEFHQLCENIAVLASSTSSPEEILDWQRCVDSYGETACKNCYDTGKSAQQPPTTKRSSTTDKSGQYYPPTSKGTTTPTARATTPGPPIRTTEERAFSITSTGNKPNVTGNKPNGTQMTFVNGGNDGVNTSLIIAVSATAFLASVVLVIVLVGLYRRRKRSIDDGSNRKMTKTTFGVANSATLQSQADSAYSTYIPYSQQGTLPAIPVNPETGYTYYLSDYQRPYTSLLHNNKHKLTDNSPEYAVPTPKHDRNRFYETPADDDNAKTRRDIQSQASTSDGYAYPDLTKPGNGWPAVVGRPPGPYYHTIYASSSEYDATEVDNVSARSYPESKVKESTFRSQNDVTNPSKTSQRVESISMLGDSADYQDVEEQFGTRYLLPHQFLQPGSSLDREAAAHLDRDIGLSATNMDSATTLDIDAADYPNEETIIDNESEYQDPEMAFRTE
ncbi:uncharacterized protein LOC117101308 isoform X2 [Anneissia japonica]|uniref:uncharacterized protein LOC117101308 isoform X2 n=1 Tax=Anneissia japonica TaxID=1529436 RepID=UPI0014258EFC|nr:uncharacterized protein LOC117101308 isoform X2 [Anneissia japonica]